MQPCDSLISCTFLFALVKIDFEKRGRFCFYFPPEAEAVPEEEESQDPLFDLETSQESEKPGSKRLRIFFHAFSQVASSEGTVGAKAVCGFKICHCYSQPQSCVPNLYFGIVSYKSIVLIVSKSNDQSI